jgi:hypothetical protein
MLYRKGVYWVCVVAVFVGFAQGGFADTIFSYNDIYGGTPPVSTNKPWMTALLKTISPGDVRLTISNLNLTASESVDQAYFNINPLLNVKSLKFKIIGGSTGLTAPKATFGEDAFKAGGDGKYDISLQFATGGSTASLFGPGKYVVCDFSGISTLTASDFSFYSTPVTTTGPFYSAAHIVRIGSNANQSGWVYAQTAVAVPEAGAPQLWLFAGFVWAVFAASRNQIPLRLARARPQTRAQS